jgi:ribose-phosphate pyrophosphokinase
MKPMVLIDSDRYVLSGIDTLVFPGGEPHVKVPWFNPDKRWLLFLKLRHWLDVGYAALVIDALIRQQVYFRVFIPYLPGARQDRSEGECGHTLEAVVRLLRLYECDAWTAVFDPHSLAVQKLLPKAQVFMPHQLDTMPIREDVVGVIAPDTGAVARAKTFRNKLYPDVPVITATKRRDPLTGWLSKYEMPSLAKEGHYIVVDDICDGGGTFNLLASAFDRDDVGLQSTLELVVSHGIFSKGVNAISPRYTRITTTNSWCAHAYDRPHDRLTVLNLESLFPLIV